METVLTYESVLALIREQSLEFRKNLEESNKKFERNLEESSKKFEKNLASLEIEDKKLQKKIDSLTGVWGKFVEGLVLPKIIEMFQARGIEIEMSAQSVKGFKNGQEFYEIDILLVDTNIAVAVEVKSTLSIDDVNEHLKRLDKIRQVKPKLFNLSGATIYGAVAGMIIEQDADRYAYKKGLFVLRQKGNIVEIVNDDKFKPTEWKVEY